jgi:hypothetical protein
MNRITFLFVIILSFDTYSFEINLKDFPTPIKSNTQIGFMPTHEPVKMIKFNPKQQKTIDTIYDIYGHLVPKDSSIQTIDVDQIYLKDGKVINFRPFEQKFDVDFGNGFPINIGNLNQVMSGTDSGGG